MSRFTRRSRRAVDRDRISTTRSGTTVRKRSGAGGGAASQVSWRITLVSGATVSPEGTAKPCLEPKTGPRSPAPRPRAIGLGRRATGRGFGDDAPVEELEASRLRPVERSAPRLELGLR